MPIPPVDVASHAVNPTAVLVMTTILLAVFASLAIFGLREWRSSHGPILLLCLVAGAFAMPFEILWDHMGRIYVYERGAQTFFDVAGRGLPYWLLPAYCIFPGGSAYLVYRLAAARVSARIFYACIGALIAIDFAMEIPLISIGKLYEYWGMQAFALGGAPAAWAFMNLGCVLSGVAIAKMRPLFQGAGALLIVPLVFFCWTAWEMGIGGPVYLANASTESKLLVYLAAATTIAFSSLSIYAVGRLAFGGETDPGTNEARAPFVTAARRH